MTVTVRWLDGGTYTAEDDRAVLSSICALPGIVNTSDLLVTQNAGGDQSVNAATGTCFVRGTLGTLAAPQYVYQLGNDSTVNIPVPNPDGSLQQNHIIGARVYDAAFDSLGQFKGTIELVPGNPGAGDPTRPADWLDIARVRQGAGVTVITNSMIDDLRTRWLPASYMSLGIVAKYERSTDSPTATTTETLIGTLSPFTALANRYYSVSVAVSATSTVANDRVQFYVRDGAIITGTQVGGVSVWIDNANLASEKYMQRRFQFSAGIHTLNFSLIRTTGTGTVKSFGSVQNPIQVFVRDEGDV